MDAAEFYGILNDGEFHLLPDIEGEQLRSFWDKIRILQEASNIARGDGFELVIAFKDIDGCAAIRLELEEPF